VLELDGHLNVHFIQSAAIALGDGMIFRNIGTVGLACKSPANAERCSRRIGLGEYQNSEGLYQPFLRK
jgi:hypothetical protein